MLTTIILVDDFHYQKQYNTITTANQHPVKCNSVMLSTKQTFPFSTWTNLQPCNRVNEFHRVL